MGRQEEGVGSPLECRPHLEPHSTEALCICTAELPVCLHEERPGCDALAAMAVPSLAFGGGGQACRWAGRRWVRRGLVVQKGRAGYAEVVVGMAMHLRDFESPETSHAPCRGRGELKPTGGMVGRYTALGGKSALV